MKSLACWVVDRRPPERRIVEGGPNLDRERVARRGQRLDLTLDRGVVRVIGGAAARQRPGRRHQHGRRESAERRIELPLSPLTMFGNGSAGGIPTSSTRSVQYLKDEDDAVVPSARK